MAEGGREAREEWSWSDSDGEGGDPLDDKSLESAVRKSSQGVANGAGVESGPNFVIHSFAGESKRTVKNEVQQMVAVGLCSVQAADMFMQLVDDGLVGRPSDQRSKLGSTQDQLAATEARLAASERALRESEEQQLRLQADLMKMTLSPYHDGGGVTAFDVARAQREAEKVLTLQRKIAESEERERQQAVMQAKMEELLRLQEVALTEREENSAQLEQEMSATEAKMRLLSEQLSQMEQTLAMEQQRNQVLEDGIVQRDEQLRRTDAEKLRLHEIQIEEKENQLRNLEARLEANGGDKIDNLKETFNHTLEERDQRVTALENELRKVKAERDESRKSLAEVRHLYTSMQSTCRELYMESEHLQMALTIVEPKVHVLQAMFSDIALQVQGQLNGRDNELAHANRMHVKMEEMDQALGQRDRQIESMKNELESLQCILKERESKIPELQEALEKQRQIVAKQNEDSLMKDQRIETLSSALEQMQYALDRTQHTMSEREARVQLLQSSLDNSQPAMSIARKAIEERDTKINALNMLLNMAESQVQEMGKALNEAKLDLKEKDDRLKVLQGRVVELETSVTGWRGELAEKDWQINAHESKISDLQGKLHSIDQDAASESGHNASSPPKILNDSVSGQGLEDCDCVQVQKHQHPTQPCASFCEQRVISRLLLPDDSHCILPRAFLPH
jgi:chromosome segregation ATPase